MSEYAILLSEHLIIVADCFNVVWVSVFRVSSHQVFELSDALLPIEYLLVHDFRFHFARVNVWLSSDDICFHTASVH